MIKYHVLLILDSTVWSQYCKGVLIHTVLYVISSPTKPWHHHSILWLLIQVKLGPQTDIHAIHHHTNMVYYIYNVNVVNTKNKQCNYNIVITTDKRCVYNTVTSDIIIQSRDTFSQECMHMYIHVHSRPLMIYNQIIVLEK